MGSLIFRYELNYIIIKEKFMESKQTGSRIRLGIFVTIAIALFIFVIYFIGNRQNLFTKTFSISGTFEDLGGLQVGNNVRFTGMNVGTVNSVEIVSDTSVKVEMVIKKHVQKFMKEDAVATIGSEGLMGNKVINILPGTQGKPLIKDGGEVRTITPVSIDDIMNNLEVTTTNAALITDDVAALTYNIRTGNGAIGKFFMDTAFANSIDKTVVNAKNAAGGFSQNMEALKDNFLLRGYYKKKEKEAAKAKKASEKK
jgi:phospholipid/cholesterol/gamma-HCH transport system substrate-binding protein